MMRRVFRTMIIDLEETTKEVEVPIEVGEVTEEVTSSLSIRERLASTLKTHSNSTIRSSSQLEATTRSHTMKSHITLSQERTMNITTTSTPWRKTWLPEALKLSRPEERRRAFPSLQDIKDLESQTEVVLSGAIEEETSEAPTTNESDKDRLG
jgi:hypothetical protein